MANQLSSDGIQWQVYFSLGKDTPPAQVEKCILISPWDKKWNDFGFKTECAIRIFYGEREALELTGKVAFLGMQSSAYKYVDARFKSKGVTENGYLEARDLDTLYTLFTSIEIYRKLIREIGVDEATLVLESINDMSFANASRSKAKWFAEAQRERAFTESLIRSSEAFFAFSNASFLLDGLEEERLDSVSSTLRLKFQLEGFGNSHELSFTFDKASVFPKNIAVVIGKNGVGKSQALAKLVVAALSNDTAVFSDSEGQRPMISRILALATPGETANTFPPPPRKRQRAIDYRRLSLARGSTGASATGLTDLVHQLARSNEEIRSERRWSLFKNALKNVLDLESVAFRLHPEVDSSNEYGFPESNYAGLDDFTFGNEERRLELRRRLVLTDPPRMHIAGKFFPMSSGQISFFRFALQACLYIENGTLVLLDEPETHLHPNLISEFVLLLNELLTTTGSIAIISTHSAYFVRELPRSQVLVLRSTNTDTGKAISCERPRLGTLGSNVGAISHFVFEDDLNTVLSRVAKDKAFTAVTLEQNKDEISLEAYLNLRERLTGKP